MQVVLIELTIVQVQHNYYLKALLQCNVRYNNIIKYTCHKLIDAKIINL